MFLSPPGPDLFVVLVSCVEFGRTAMSGMFDIRLPKFTLYLDMRTCEAPKFNCEVKDIGATEVFINEGTQVVTYLADLGMMRPLEAV
jgi:hypothetical protein